VANPYAGLHVENMIAGGADNRVLFVAYFVGSVSTT
jgi:hypothetical protein